MSATLICPACHNLMDHAEPLWEISSVPVHSCQLFDDPSSACAIASGEIQLLSCRHCGMVFNQRFDPLSQRFNTRYEETQACSDHFNSFARQLVRDLVQRYDLTGKRILEAGCGKGHFLAELCRAGGNIGLGVDPSFDPNRHPAPESPHLAYEQSALSMNHSRFVPDLVCHRHTLEHIKEVQQFLTLCLAVGHHEKTSENGCTHIIEVPDFERIAREGAFWDIYYEHVNYFTSTSLKNALNHCGYQVDEIETLFHDQYLLAHATGAAKHDAQEIPGSIQNNTAQIKNTLSNSLSRWRGQLEQWRQNGESAILWGGGSKAVAFLTTLAANDSVIRAAVDINPNKQGCYLPGTGHPVIAPSSLQYMNPRHIIIMNPAYDDEISQSCRQFSPGSALMTVNDLMSSD